MNLTNKFDFQPDESIHQNNYCTCVRGPVRYLSSLRTQFLCTNGSFW